MGFLTANAPPEPPATCLYLGPRGERCDQPATEDGFCDRHRSVLPLWFPRLHRLAAVILLAAFLFMAFADVIREALAWLP